MGENRLVQQVFPIAGEFLLGRDVARDRARAAADAADHDAVADLRGSGRTERQRIDVDAAERLHQAETGFGIEAQRVTFHHAAIAEMQPDRFGLGDQIADGQHQSVVDQHAVAGALGAEGFGGERIVRDDRMQADHRGQRAIEVETVVPARGWTAGGTFHSVKEGIDGLLAKGACSNACETDDNLWRKGRSLKYHPDSSSK